MILIKFIGMCKTELNWENSSEDTVMVIGNDFDMLCCTAVLQEFSGIRHLISLGNGMTFNWPPNKGTIGPIRLFCANIEIRESLEEYEGKIDKIISIDVLDHIQNKELAFKNIYRLLKPGGEIGVVFNLNNLSDAWLKKLASMDKWKKYKEEDCLLPFFPGSVEGNYYENMLEGIGFLNVRSERQDSPISFDNPESLEKLFRTRDYVFKKVPQELEPEFQIDSIQLLWEDAEEGPMHFIGHKMYLFAVKPSNSCS